MTRRVTARHLRHARAAGLVSFRLRDSTVPAKASPIPVTPYRAGVWLYSTYISGTSVGVEESGCQAVGPGPRPSPLSRDFAFAGAGGHRPTEGGLRRLPVALFTTYLGGTGATPAERPDGPGGAT
jgi:hypothetical protein